MHSRLVVLCVIVATTFMLKGCSGVGARAVHAGSLDYNIALQRADDRQMLLNLVRLRYRDRPYFLEVSSLATQFSISSTFGAIGAFGSPELEQDLLASSGLGVEEQPTVSYQPLQGEEFAQRLLSPIELQTIVLLANSGWSIERILRLSVQRMNGLPNAPTATGPTPQMEPEYKRFMEAARYFRELQQQDQMSLYIDRRDGQAYLAVNSRGRESRAYKELVDLLDLSPGRAHYLLTTGAASADGKSIGLELRSLIGIMSFVSQAVDAPAGDALAGLVTTTTSKDGTAFDWGAVSDSLVAISSQPGQPKSAAVAVQYRGSWFYIDDSDLDSKSSFSLLGQLFALRVGKGSGPTPTLTLPIGN